MIENLETSENKYLKQINIFEDSIIYFKLKFENFDINKFIIEYLENVGFEIKFSYSYDNINWSNPVFRENWNFVNNDFDSIELKYIYLSILCFEENNQTNEAKSLTVIKNNENTNINCIKIKTINYDSTEIDITDEKNLFIKTYFSIVNKFPKWNFYDNQQMNIRRWLDTCISISQSYGHTCIYFKTEPVETNFTFSNHVLRNVVSIKKILIMSPGNELPQDRNIYSEWDMPLDGDFVIHIVNEIFKTAFGDNKVPLSKDYLYLPIINKLFRVSSVQPKNGFMGKIGWWETFLTKYEEDETIDISDEIKEVYSGFEGFEEGFTLIEELENFKENKIITKEKLQEKNIDEKKNVTDNFSNKLVDSSNYIDLKETEIQREFYSKRLDIVSINPDNNSFPVTMYNCSTVEKRVIALTYNLVDLVSVNKKTLIVDNLEFSFNFVLLQKFVGELLDFNDENNLSSITLEFNRNKLSIIYHKYQKTFVIDYVFILQEFYNIVVKYDEKLKQISIIILLLKDKVKNIVYQNLYIINDETNFPNKIELKNIYLYGGQYLINELLLKINNDKILSDNVNPVLIMNKTGL